MSWLVEETYEDEGPPREMQCYHAAEIVIVVLANIKLGAGDLACALEPVRVGMPEIGPRLYSGYRDMLQCVQRKRLAKPWGEYADKRAAVLLRGPSFSHRGTTNWSLDVQ